MFLSLFFSNLYAQHGARTQRSRVTRFSGWARQALLKNVLSSCLALLCSCHRSTALLESGRDQTSDPDGSSHLLSLLQRATVGKKLVSQQATGSSLLPHRRLEPRPDGESASHIPNTDCALCPCGRQIIRGAKSLGFSSLASFSICIPTYVGWKTRSAICSHSLIFLPLFSHWLSYQGWQRHAKDGFSGAMVSDCEGSPGGRRWAPLYAQCLAQLLCTLWSRTHWQSPRTEWQDPQIHSISVPLPGVNCGGFPPAIPLCLLCSQVPYTYMYIYIF